MGLVLAVTTGLVIWIVLWALGYSGLDSGLLALIVMVLGASGRIALRHLVGGSARPGRLVARRRRRRGCGRLTRIASPAWPVARAAHTTGLEPACAPTERHAACVLALAALAGCGSTQTRTTADAGCGTRWLTVYSDLPVARRRRRRACSRSRTASSSRCEQAGTSAPATAACSSSASTTPGRRGVWSPGLTAQVAQRGDGEPERRRLHRRLRLGRDRDLAADHRCRRHPPGQPVEPLRRPHRRRTPPTTRATRSATSQAATTPSRGSSPPTTTRPRATVDYMADAGVTRLYVLGDVSDPFDADIAQLVANDAPGAGITLVGYSSDPHRDQHAAARLRRRSPRRSPRARADAVVLGGDARRRRARAVERAARGAAAREAVRAEHAGDARLPRAAWERRPARPT